MLADSSGSGSGSGPGPASASTETETETDTGSPLPIGRFGRVLALVAFVTAIFLFISSQTLADRPTLFNISVVVIGSVGVVTAITGFLISVASYVGGEP